MIENLKEILLSSMNATEKQIASAIVLDVPLTGIGISGKSISRHEQAAREFVEGLSSRASVADAPGVRGAWPEKKRPPRESADPERWMAEQERDLEGLALEVQPPGPISRVMHLRRRILGAFVELMFGRRRRRRD
jgi:hypothetical protein